MEATKTVIHLRDREIKNAIEELVYGVFDGPRELAKLLDLSTQAFYGLLSQGLVRSRETALRLQALSKEKGCEIPAAELMKLDGVPWRGPDRHPDAPSHGKGTSNGSTARKAAPSRSPASVSAMHAKAPTKRKGRKRGLATRYPTFPLAAVG